MSYESPITMYTERIVKDIMEKQDGYLMECVREVGFDVNKEELAKALAYDRDQYDKGYHDGRMYQFPVMTNADRIRAMTDEELAEFIVQMEVQGRDLCGTFGVKHWLDWLKQEATE